MQKAKVVAVKDKSKFSRNYGILDYNGIAEALKANSSAFVFNTKKTPLKAQTMWKASKRLSTMVDKKVIAVKGTLNKREGYLFSVKEAKH